MREFVILLIVISIFGYYGYREHLFSRAEAKSNPTEVFEAKPASKPQKGTVKHFDDLTLITQDEFNSISAQMNVRHDKGDYSPIILSDGTQIPITFTPNGKICSRTGLPEGSISLNAKLGILQ